MAKPSPPIQDLTLFADYLNFFPPEDKNSLWLAQAIFYSHQNSVVFLDPKRKKEYRRLEKGELNEQDYINMIDPVTPMGSGGKAEYFSADMKTCPIDVHMDNIVRARLDKICLENKLQVSEIDKFAINQKARERKKIIYQRQFRALIDDVNKEIGLPPIKDSQSIDEFIKNLSGEQSKHVTTNIDQTLDFIRQKIKDNEDLQLYNMYVYKGDIERAFELGIQHYLIDLNKWSIISEWFTNDIKNFNKTCGRWYTDETNGRGTVEYLEPDRLYTNPFQRNNGEDITMWHYEYPVTFAEFVRQFGTTMTDEQLKEVFELNRNSGTRHGMSFSRSKSFKGSNTTIMIGVFSVLTQDADSFSEEFTKNRLPLWDRKPPSWLPKENNKDGEGSRRQRIYNTWYSCYYVPPPGDRQARNQMADWLWQSQYIFNIKKDIDMYRYGVDFRYAKSTLVLYKDETRMSYTDVKEAFMPKIRNLWHKLQNCFVQDIQALGIAKDFMGAALKAIDETNKHDPGDPAYPTGGNGKDPSVETMKMMRQGNMIFLEFRDSKTGEYITDPGKLFVPVDSKHIEKAERYLGMILRLYQAMQISLVQNPALEGQEGKSHQTELGIQTTLSANDNGMWYVEKPVREVLKMFAERCIQWLIAVLKEHKVYGYADRWNELSSVIGLANSWMLESVEEMQAEDLGVTIELENIDFYKKYIFDLATHMAEEKEISRDGVAMVMSQAAVNWKYSYALLMLMAKEQKAELANKEELQFQRQMALEREKAKTARAGIMDKAQGKNLNIDRQGQWDVKVNDELNKGKSNTMSENINQRKNNKIEQDNNKANLDKQKETYDAISPKP